MIRRVLTLLAVLALAACAGSPPPPPPTFPPLDYSYLPPIMLKVSSVTVVNQYVPDPGASALIAQDPEPPATALLAMLNRRIVANGTPGMATVTIEAASIDQVGDNLTGTMTVRLDVQSADGRSTGYTEASVTHSETAPDPNSSPDAMQTALYGMTKQLMDAMNVQLQYQIQQNLGSWISYSANAAVPPVSTGPSANGLPGGIQATPLAAPGAATGAAPVTPTLVPPAAPAVVPPAAPTVTPPANPTVIPPYTPMTIPQ